MQINETVEPEVLWGSWMPDDGSLLWVKLWVADAAPPDEWGLWVVPPVPLAL